ncbi:MAG: hypothetical protein AAFY63_22560, partial [Cyanobacteria bacterium J06643_13]
EYSSAFTVLANVPMAVANPTAKNNSIDFMLKLIPISIETFENTVNENSCQLLKMIVYSGNSGFSLSDRHSHGNRKTLENKPQMNTP